MATEHRLIDANELLLGKFVEPRTEWHQGWNDALDAAMLQAPTVDAVPVVRCKDCKNFERKFSGYGYCYHWDYECGMSPNEVEDNDFCSHGERRTDNGCPKKMLL